LPDAVTECDPAEVGKAREMMGPQPSLGYKYGPFGEVIRATGPMARANPFRVSTKYEDDETDLLYYGYRYYNPSTGRCLSRDPLREQGFQVVRKGLFRHNRFPVIRRENGNFYVMVGNRPLSDVDPLGLYPCPCKCGPDVTMALYQTLQDIADTYDSASYFRKYLARRSMLEFPFPLWSWDILWLYRWSYTSPGGCGHCNDTVTFEGGCVNATELNYMMFGLGVRLLYMDAEIIIGEMVAGLKIRSLFPGGDTSDAIQRKAGFAMYGAGEYQAVQPWMWWPWNCEPNKEKYEPDIHYWEWLGLKWEHGSW